MREPTSTIDAAVEPDPRPSVVTLDGEMRVHGQRCAACELARSTPAPRCPDCGGHLEDADFGPDGTVWSSTIVHLDISGIDAPYGLAYVDLDDGPRLLVHTIDATSPIAVGSRVAIVDTTERGDIRVAPTDRASAR